MKPRRWYSSPEFSPTQEPPRPSPFPNDVYWAFTTRTRSEQGPIIKSAPADLEAAQQGRAAPAQARAPRLIDAA